jgi:exodeoxyribonuclease-5
VIEGFGEFGLDRNLSRNTLFIVDEASMISNQTMDLSVFGSGRLLDDLIRYVFSGAGCKLVLIGDDAQLPPVGFPDSNALNSSYLSRYGFPVSEYTLREVVRHTANSGILFNATKMREYLAVKHTGLPAIVADKFDDVVSISGQDLPGLIEQSYQDVGVEETMVVCRSNKQANRYNLGIRNMILQYEEEIS